VSVNSSKFNKYLQQLFSMRSKSQALKTLKLWLLLTGGRCSEEAYIIKIEIRPFKWGPL
jgi:hypothetical protein